VLLSGGLDSYTVAAVAKRDGFSLFALSINYGQRHAQELEASRTVAKALGVERHLELDLDLTRIGGSALTSSQIDVPKDQPIDPAVIPTTYVPARNTIFLSVAMGWAEVLGASDIFIGVNALDYSGYPDCRPPFIAAFQALANQATRAGVEGVASGKGGFTIHAPLQDMTKADIAREAARLGLDAAISHSCYDPAADGGACGLCDACRLRAKGFAEADLPDPTRYASR
jgi:7-cyano-7-deazaguanine synthase